MVLVVLLGALWIPIQLSTGLIQRWDLYSSKALYVYFSVSLFWCFDLLTGVGGKWTELGWFVECGGSRRVWIRGGCIDGGWWKSFLFFSLPNAIFFLFVPFRSWRERKFIEISDSKERNCPWTCFFFAHFFLSMFFFLLFFFWSFSSLVSPNRCNCARKRSRWWMPLTSVTRCWIPPWGRTTAKCTNSCLKAPELRRWTWTTR